MSWLEAVGDWLDERTGSRSWARAWMDSSVASEPVWRAALTTAVVTCIGVLALSGVVLMTAYAPSPQTAWASVHYIQFVLAQGWILRGLHYWAAQMLFVLAALHILLGALGGVYRGGREISWWLTLAIFALALGEGITGGLLPWDQRGWWARLVEGNIAGLTPVLGGWIAQMLSGGPELGALGLTRAFAGHVILLPLLIAAVLWGRRALWQRANRTAQNNGEPMIPRAEAMARSAIAALVTICVAFAFTGAVHGAPLEAPADPLSDYPARPEWFLLTLFQLRKLFHGPLEFPGISVVPGLVALYFVLLPWIDRPGRSRVVAVAPAVLIFVAAAGLALFAVRHDATDPQVVRAKTKWDQRAARASLVAMNGVPAAGALEMMRHDPEVRGEDLFERHCASCHVLGDLGDPKKATATDLTGWGTTAWIEAMIHDPDAPRFFGRGPFNDEMPSVDAKPKNWQQGAPWKPMVKSEADRHAVALFLAMQGDEPGDPVRSIDAPTKKLLETAEKLVNNRCTSCHLFGEEGDDEGNGLAPQLRGYGSIAWTRAQIENPATPRSYRDKALSAELKKHMPRFDKDLSAADIDILAQWTRRHARAAQFKP
jgi:ubiquinol-cytochrome c reductase cytochrome b subunit